MAKEAFGGAKVVYVAQKIGKESKQPEPEGSDFVQRPRDEERGGDLITYYHDSTGMNGFHSRCLRIKSDCTVGLGIDVLDDSKEEATIVKLSSVNEEGQSFLEVVGRVSLDYETTGAGAMEIVRGGGGDIVELYHCPNISLWRRKRGFKGPQLQYKTASKDQNYYFFNPKNKNSPGKKDKVGEILWIQNYNQASKYYGLPDWRGVIPKIELAYYATMYNRKFFINSGIPDLAIVVEGGAFDEDTEKKVVDFFQTNFRGVENAHRTLYLPINEEGISVRFEKLAMEQKDKDGSFQKMQQDCRDDIVSAHGVPPRLVGIMSAGQLGGTGEIQGQLKIFHEIVINPRQDLFEMKLKPVTKLMGIDVDWQFKEINTKIQEKDSEYYPAMVTSGILDENEAREELGYGKKKEDPENDDEDEIFPDKMIDALEKMIRGM